jgi:4-amino-4-deoxychorismate lyase
MSRLVESIRLHEGHFARLSYHQARIDATFLELYGRTPDWRIEDVLKSADVPTVGLYKCRLLYDDQSAQTELQPYTIRPVRSLKLVTDNKLAYRLKWEERTDLSRLFNMRGACDDVLIVQRGCITDTYYANVVLRRGDEWFTPSTCLLRGTMRQWLLDEQKIRIEEIRTPELGRFQKVKLINALLEWEGPELDVSDIF